MAILKIKDKGVWKEIQAIKGDTGHDVYVGDKSKAPSEAKLIIEPVKGTATGTDIQVTDSANDRVSKLVLDGKSTQETRSGKNIIKNEGINQTINGITYTINNDKSITCKGTATARSEFYLYNNSSNPLPIKPNTTYINTTNIMVILNTDNGYKVFMPKRSLDTGSATQIRQVCIRVENGESINETLYPMLSEQGGEYEPYGASPSPDYPSEIENVKGKNLFDKTLSIANKYLNSNDGALLNSSSSSISDFINVSENTQYTISGYGTTSYYKVVSYYDSSKSFISSNTATNSNNTYSITTPSNAKFLRFHYLSTNENQVQIEKGSIATRYVPYGNIQIVETGKNLFDKSTIVAGDIKGDNSSIRLSSRQALWLEPGTYTMSTNAVSPFRYVCIVQNVGVPPLPSYPKYILDSGWKTGNASYTFSLTTAGYFTFSVSKTNNATLTVEEIENFEYQLEKCPTKTNYEPYTEEVVNIDLKGNELCSLPNGTKDELIVKDGRAKIIKRIGKINLKDLIWKRNTAQGDIIYWTTTGINNIKYVSNNTELGLGYAEKYKMHIGKGMSSQEALNTIAIDVSQVTVNSYESPTGIFYYELREPYEIDLGEVSTLTTYEGTSNITNSEDTNMSIEYVTNKTNLYYQNNGNIIKMNEGS